MKLRVENAKSALIKTAFLCSVIIFQTGWIDGTQWRYNRPLTNDHADISIIIQRIHFAPLDPKLFPLRRLRLYKGQSESAPEQLTTITFYPSSPEINKTFIKQRPFIRDCKDLCLNDSNPFFYTAEITHSFPSSIHSGTTEEHQTTALARLWLGPKDRVFLELLDSAGLLLFEIVHDQAENQFKMFELSKAALQHVMQTEVDPAGLLNRIGKSIVDFTPNHLLGNRFRATNVPYPYELTKIDFQGSKSFFRDDSAYGQFLTLLMGKDVQDIAERTEVYRVLKYSDQDLEDIFKGIKTSRNEKTELAAQRKCQRMFGRARIDKFEIPTVTVWRY